MYAYVVLERLLPGGARPLSDAARAADAPDLAGFPGLVAYYVLHLGEEVYATIAVFEGKDHADRWGAACRDYANRLDLTQYIDKSIGVQGFGGQVVFTKQQKS